MRRAFTIKGIKTRFLTPWITSATQSLERQSRLAVKNGPLLTRYLPSRLSHLRAPSTSDRLAPFRRRLHPCVTDRIGHPLLQSESNDGRANSTLQATDGATNCAPGSVSSFIHG